MDEQSPEETSAVQCPLAHFLAISTTWSSSLELFCSVPRAAIKWHAIKAEWKEEESDGLERVKQNEQQE